MLRFRFCLVLALLLSLTTPALAKKPKTSNKNKHELTIKDFRAEHQKIIDKILEGKGNVALGIARTILGRYPRSGRAHLLMGFVYKAQKKYASAINFFKKSAGLFDTQTDFFEKGQALYNVAFCHELAKERQKALASWQVYLSHTNANLREVSGAEFARARIIALKTVLKAAQKKK